MKNMALFMAILFLLPVANAKIFAEVFVDDGEESNAFNEMLFDAWLKNEIIYVMLPIQNEFSNERLFEYNATYPAMFLDGGYRVVKSHDEVEQAMQDCMDMKRNDIKLEVKAEWLECPCMRGLNIVVKIKNNENKPYNGTLRIYVTEMNSRWKNDGGERYHFSFLEFASVENISTDAKGEFYRTVIWDTKQHFPDIYDKGKNNVAVIAALFQQEWHVGYADPPKGREFKAHYLDAVNISIPSNVPPYVSIYYPKEGHLYIFGREIFKTVRTIIVGGIVAKIKTWDDHGIKKLELYEDGEFVKNLEGDEFKWNGKGFHSIEIIAYDDIQSSIDSIDALLL